MEDILGLLLPEAADAERARLRRVITALRLLRDDARTGCERRSGASWRKARAELEARERGRRWRSLEGLLHAYLQALRPADSFLDLGESPMGLAPAWRRLLDERKPVPGFPPDPAHPPVAVVEGLLSALASEGAPRSRRSLWELRLRHCRSTPDSAARSWERSFRAAVALRAPRIHQARLLAGWVAARLESHRPAWAFELFRAHPELALVDPGLRRLLGWAALLCGQEEPGRALLEGVALASALPAPLVDLRTDWPEFLAVLGCSPAKNSASRQPGCPERSAIGALLIWVAIRTPVGLRTLVLDTEPSLRARVEHRLSRDPNLCGPLGPEPLRRWRRRRADPPLRQAMAGPRTVALVRASLVDEAGTPRGWIQIESGHQLLPSAAQIEDMRCWARAQAGWTSAPVSGPPATPPVCTRAFSPADPRHAFTERLFAALTPLTGRRAYWIEPDDAETECIRAECGGSLGDRDSRPGRAGILRKGADRLEVVRFQGGDDGIHAAAAAGLAVPLLDTRGVRRVGLLVLEFEHSDLLTEEIVRSTRAVLQALEPWWWAAAFRAWHLALEGDDLAWDPEHRYIASLDAVARGTGGHETLLLVGSCGAGRRTLARWLHFRGPNSRRPFVEGRGAEGVEAATRLLELEGLDRGAQVELARRIEARSAAQHILLSHATASVLRERGQLARELERCLDPLPLFVPPLHERRDEIRDLAHVLAGNTTRREGLPAVQFEDEAIALLWRQDWNGGVAELAALVSRAARAHSGGSIGTADLLATSRAHRTVLRTRLPSLKARSADLEMALASTRHRNGSENHARAARYLGWDPATLQKRLKSASGTGRGPGPAPEAEGDCGASGRLQPSPSPPGGPCDGLAP